MNRLMIRHTMDKPLPYDAELEYIESTGTQYIDTGILATSTTSMECQFAFLDSQCPGFMCMGATHGRNCGFFNLSAGYTAGKLGAYMSADVRNGAEIDYDTQYHTYYLSASEQRIDNTITSYTSGQHFGYNSQSGDTRQPINIHLLKRNIDFEATTYGYMTCRLKYVRIMNNGILVRDYIPVRKGNTGYMYDKVSGRLFGNQGTGDFVVGPDYNPFAHQYLTFIPVEDAVFTWAERATSGHLEYSVNGGQTWVTIADGESTPTITAGSKVIWRGDLKPTTTSSGGIGTFSASGNYNAYGNTMSLLFYDNYYGSQLNSSEYNYVFCKLFYYDTHILSTPLLPATTLKKGCYYGMFSRCTSLTTASELPATILAVDCCYSMFSGCTSLTTAPALPTTTLASYCYQSMFSGCTSLTTAPELPATALVSNCYKQMFNGCTSLNYVKCLATSGISTTNLNNWLSGVSATGTFVKDANTTWPTGGSGIPSGWTVVDDPSTINS